MDGGTLLSDALVAMIIVGSVISANTIPPTIGADLGKFMRFKKIANPKRPKIIDGTAARLLILTSTVKSLDSLDKNSIDTIIKNSEEKISLGEISDKERYLLSYKIDTLREINK